MYKRIGIKKEIIIFWPFDNNNAILCWIRVSSLWKSFVISKMTLTNIFASHSKMANNSIFYWNHLIYVCVGSSKHNSIFGSDRKFDLSIWGNFQDNRLFVNFAEVDHIQQYTIELLLFFFDQIAKQWMWLPYTAHTQKNLLNSAQT